MRIKKIDLFAELFEKENGLPEIFAGMEFDTNNIAKYSPSIKKKISTVYYLKFVPDYLVFPLVDESLFLYKKLIHVKGYSIKLDDVTDVNSYIKTQFKSNAKTINRYVNRLESCFNIEYKMFYGEIDEDNYKFIMDSLFFMMRKRFSQLQVNNESEAKWEHTRAILYDLIQLKRASLFVIYADSKPIEISINYHLKGILFSSISSYDIDYSKFGLGHVEIVKQLEWCLANNHKIFEMGRGDLDYKRRWSNQIYNFEHHIVYLKDSFYGRLWSIKEVGLNRLKAYLKSKNIDLILKNIKDKLSPKYDKNGFIEYKVETLNTNFSEINIPPIYLDQEAHAHLKKYVYDFLYSNIEHISQIKIFCLEEGKAYIIKGEKTSVKIYLEN